MKRFVHIVMLAVAAFAYASAVNRADDPVPDCYPCQLSLSTNL